MEVFFLALGMIDFLAGSVLFLDQSLIARALAIVLLTKGVVTIFNSIQH
jgi:hypothetical protein